MAWPVANSWVLPKATVVSTMRPIPLAPFMRTAGRLCQGMSPMPGERLWNHCCHQVRPVGDLSNGRRGALSERSFTCCAAACLGGCRYLASSRLDRAPLAQPMARQWTVADDQTNPADGHTRGAKPRAFIQCWRDQRPERKNLAKWRALRL